MCQEKLEKALLTNIIVDNYYQYFTLAQRSAVIPIHSLSLLKKDGQETNNKPSRPVIDKPKVAKFRFQFKLPNALTKETYQSAPVKLIN